MVQVLVRVGVGFDNVDIKAAAAQGIVVCNVPDYGTEEVKHACGTHVLLLADSSACDLQVADSALSHILNLLRRTHWSACQVAAGQCPGGAQGTINALVCVQRARGCDVMVAGQHRHHEGHARSA